MLHRQKKPSMGRTAIFTVAWALVICTALTFYANSQIPPPVRFIERCEPAIETINGGTKRRATERRIPASYFAGFKPEPGCKKLICKAEGSDLNPGPEKCEQFTEAGFEAGWKQNLGAYTKLAGMGFGVIIAFLAASSAGLFLHNALFRRKRNGEHAQ